MENALSPAVQKQALKSLQDEADGAAIYHFMAKRQQKKHPENAKILEQMSKDESQHYQMWAKLTGKTRRAHVFWKRIITVLLGFTFVVKSMQKGERLGQASYEKLQAEVPAAAQMLADERRHEKTLYALLDEERLHYVGAMVLGLNDALVELTGAITGVTFSLQDCKTIALTGIVTGIAATLSMMASNYLAESSEGHKDALKSSLYTGAAYLVTVALLVLPYLLFINAGEYAYLYAFIVMISIVILEIAFFNFYISVAQEKPFWKHFLLMLGISLGVAALSYGIGLLAKLLLGINV
ncbi:MAG: VIT family protein [Tenericutes bacterium ADurb.BinA155]|jgi:VIT1/CCC1 family predicted Fe2+/Mn2+ transporter|nr:MAG: VIT family protein [Tenericutes bacterium ADurb.BinA155]